MSIFGFWIGILLLYPSMTTFHGRKQDRIAAKMPPERVGIPIVNCEFSCMYVESIQTLGGIAKSAICDEATTDTKEIKISPDTNTCLNAGCGHIERI